MSILSGGCQCCAAYSSFGEGPRPSTTCEEGAVPRGTTSFELADPATGKQKAVLDLAWPTGIQEELSQPVAVLLNENDNTIAIASQAGFKCYTSIDEFKEHVQTEVLAEEVTI